MRIIDYIMIQLVNLIKEPEYLTMNEDYVLQQKNNKENNMEQSKRLKAKRVWGDLDEIFKKFICPTFLDMRICLNNPLLL